MENKEPELARDDTEPLEIESLCMLCSENGTTRLLTTSIPHFRDVVIMSFECPHCGHRNNELQPVQTSEAKGVHLLLKIPEERPDLLSRQIVKSDKATIKIPELEFEIPAARERGCLTTVEGLLRQVIADLMELQQERRAAQPEKAARIDEFCQKLKNCANGDNPFTIELDDPSGNSFIESSCAAIDDDEHLEQKFYERTAEQSRALGLVVPEGELDNVHHGDGGRGFVLSESETTGVMGNAFIHHYSAPEEVMVFPGQCLMCQRETETRMYPTKIPYFKEVIIMANSCELCGYKNSEVRPGGGISQKGRTIRLTVSGKEDLDRDVIKSDSATLEIPSVALTIRSGTAMITTVEGILHRTIDDLKKMFSFQLGDSAPESDKEKYEAFFRLLEELLECKKEWEIVMKDPLANSFVMPLCEKIEEDSHLQSEEYERSHQENVEYGIDALQSIDEEKSS